MSEPVILLLSGANFSLMGQRQPEVYGAASLTERVADAAAVARAGGFALEHVQSDSVAELVQAIHGARGRCAAVVINPGAFTHYAWALHDALATYDGVKVEFHISNPTSRDSWRHTSVVSPVAHAVQMGMGPHAYPSAVQMAITLLS